MTAPLLILLQAASAAEAPIPLEPGTYWEYRESYTELAPDGLASTQDDTTRFEVHGRPGRLFVDQRGGFDPSPGPVERTETWLRLGPWTGEEALPLPLEPGSAGPRSEGGGAWMVEATEPVAVPAGTFVTVRCAFRTHSTVSILWIAPGVGVVRETHGEPGRHPEIERVLLRWGTPAREPAPRSQELRTRSPGAAPAPSGKGGASRTARTARPMSASRNGFSTKPNAPSS